MVLKLNCCFLGERTIRSDTLYKIGFIEDSDKQFRRYKKKIEKTANNLQFEISLSLVEDTVTCEDVAEWILDNKVECLIVDYKLSDKYAFSGVELINCINRKIRELPCVILTSFPNDAISEKLVIKPLIFDKEIMTEETTNSKVIKFVEMLIHSIEVFRNRMKTNEQEYEILLEKHRNGTIKSDEFENLEELLKLLKAYNLIEDISIVSLNKKVEQDISNLLDDIDKLLKK